jgi:nicotinamide-nucleotide adenylyltransferase
LFPGRFQPIHLGHIEVIKWTLEKFDEIIIVIGSSQESHTIMNPFSAGERIEMIRKALIEFNTPLERVYTIPVPDLLMNSVWPYHVRSYTPRFEAVVARNPLVVRLFREAGYEVLVPPAFNRYVYNSTNIRALMISGDESWKERVPKSVYEFIKEIKGDERLKTIAGVDK